MNNPSPGYSADTGKGIKDKGGLGEQACIQIKCWWSSRFNGDAGGVRAIVLGLGSILQGGCDADTVWITLLGGYSCVCKHGVLLC